MAEGVDDQYYIEPVGIALEGTATESTLVEPTAFAQSITETPNPTAEAALIIRSASGEEIGNGSVRVFHDTQVQHGQTTRVELEVFFNNYYITPTPFGPRTPIPAITVTPRSTSRTPQADRPTLEQPQFEGDPELIELYQLMGASLICAPSSFRGCSEEIESHDTKRVGFNGVSWTWILVPQENANGLQDLEIALWRLISINNAPVEPDVLWNYNFQVDIQPASAPSSNSLWIIVGVLAVLVIIGLAALMLRRKKQPQPKPSGTARKPKIFISYRRSSSWAVALQIHNDLKARGANVFMDVHDLKDGRFEAEINHQIETCDYFLLVLSPTTLESEWVIKEAIHALTHNRQIVPVLTDGFELYRNPLPESLNAISNHNAVTLTLEYFEAGLRRLAQFVGLSSP